MRTEPIEIGEEYGSQYKGRYVFQEISWAKRSRIIQKYTKYHPITGQIVKSDYVAIQAETIRASLKEQPEHKPITLEKLLSEENGIPIGVGELFSQIVNKLNNVGLEETRFLSEQSEDRNQVQQLQSSESAKNLGGPPKSLEGNRRRKSRGSS